MTTEIEEKDPKQLAVAKLWEVDYEDISLKSYDHYGLEVFSCGSKEWASFVCNIAQAMAEEFQMDNKNFNYSKWIQAVHKEN